MGDGSWHWEDCGVLDVAGAMEVRLCDLTGFEGRVDALAFVPDGKRPVRPAPATEEGGAFDFVVVGGGFAGLCAAVAAARAGARTALVQDRPKFGGNGSNECRVRPEGGLGVGPFPRNGDLMAELRPMMSWGRGAAGVDNYSLDDRAVAAWLAAEPNLSLRGDGRDGRPRRRALPRTRRHAEDPGRGASRGAQGGPFRRPWGVTRRREERGAPLPHPII